MSKTLENNQIINTSNLSTKYGLIAGAIMALTLVLFQLAGNDYSPFLKLTKYMFLGIAIVIALNTYKSQHEGDIFVKGIGVGTKISLIAALILALANIIIYLVMPELAFSKYSVEPTNVKQVSVISGVLLFETFVFGGLITFATLQYLKGK